MQGLWKWSGFPAVFDALWSFSAESHSWWIVRNMKKKKGFTFPTLYFIYRGAPKSACTHMQRQVTGCRTKYGMITDAWGTSTVYMLLWWCRRLWGYCCVWYSASSASVHSFHRRLLIPPRTPNTLLTLTHTHTQADVIGVTMWMRHSLTAQGVCVCRSVWDWGLPLWLMQNRCKMCWAGCLPAEGIHLQTYLCTYTHRTTKIKVTEKTKKQIWWGDPDINNMPVLSFTLPQTISPVPHLRSALHTP